MPMWSGCMWVPKIRVNGRCSVVEAKSSRQAARVSSVRIPVSTTAQPSSSSRPQTLMWSSAIGKGMRIQTTPGAICCTLPGSGADLNG
ncbi:MAG: hypothetical protein BWX79_03063 [Alphaproteobacteria bacterium ADurb.Bin100]|nr:MAG: hypothetical protein BWX79_03063 [Alphaproteobacteria bacterium ADurb.Bin100]